MVPPAPSPQINFKPLPQSPGGRPSYSGNRPGGSYNQVQRRPSGGPATSPPRRTEVETPPHRYILLGKPGESRPVNEMSGENMNWKLKDRKPVNSQPTTQSAIHQRPHFGSPPTRPTMNPHHDVYIGRPGTYPARKPQYPSPQPPLPPPPPPQSYRPMIQKPDANLVPPNWDPPKNPFNREPTLVHVGQDAGNDVVVTITETVPVNSGEIDVHQVLHTSPVCHDSYYFE